MIVRIADLKPDKIVKETQKAYLIEAQGKRFWIMKRWLNKDGDLTPAGLQSMQEANTMAYEKEAFKIAREAKKANYKATESPVWENEKSVGYDLEFFDGISNRVVRKRVFIPKSQINADGTIPAWLVDKKLDEIFGDDALQRYMNAGKADLIKNPFEKNFNMGAELAKIEHLNQVSPPPPSDNKRAKEPKEPKEPKTQKTQRKKQTKQAPTQKIKAVSNNAGLERQFRKELQDFSLKVNHSLAWWLKSKFNAPNADKNIVKELEKEFKHLSEYWIKKADELGKEILPKLFAKIGKSADMPFLKNVDFDPTRKSQELKNAIQASISENMALIKSIPQEAIQRHSAIMYQAVNDFDEQALMKELTTISNIGKRRAKMIAGDQVKKALNSYSRARAQSLGYQYYEWLSSKDERVSTGYGGHKQLNGRIYRLDKPTAVIDSYGHIGHPGQRVNCRCSSAVVYLMPNQELELIKDSQSGDFYKVKERESE